MTPPRKSARPVEEPAKTWPFVIEFCMVQGVGFRCVAYRDQEGKWHDAHTDEVLHGDIQILE